MKVVNPYGRTVNTGADSYFAIQPRACMCSTEGGEYAGERGTNDRCLHCGCSCGMSADNAFVAKFTIRESP